MSTAASGSRVAYHSKGTALTVFEAIVRKRRDFEHRGFVTGSASEQNVRVLNFHLFARGTGWRRLAGAPS
jgi:hypothetical protein